MSVQNTIWFWGLGALLIPLAIHLWNRQQSSILPFGSIRFLLESASNKSKNIQFNEFWLFIVRSSLLIMLVLFLAGLFFKQAVEKENWLLLGDQVAIPEAFMNSTYQSKAVEELTEGNDIADAWSFLSQLAQDNPQLDSLVWIDDFEKLRFIGAIPQLPFHVQMIDHSSTYEPAKLKPTSDTLTYAIQGLQQTDSILIERILKTISSYTKSSLSFKRTASTAEITFTRKEEVSDEQGLIFQFLSNTITPVELAYQNGKKVVGISSDYLADERKHQSLLLLIGEYIGQHQQPLFSLAVEERTEGFAPFGGKSKQALMTSWPFSDQLIMLFIILLLLLERFIVYRKFVANG